MNSIARQNAACFVAAELMRPCIGSIPFLGLLYNIGAVFLNGELLPGA